MRVPLIDSWAKPNAANDLQAASEIPAGDIQKQVASVEELFPTLTQLTGSTHRMTTSSMACRCKRRKRC